jgi:hypothetical protein
MFDDLRNSADDQSGFSDVSGDAELEPLLQKKPQVKGKTRKASGRKFLGMTAFQRFMISALLFLLVCIMGMMLVMFNSSAQLF